jgi:hypothetical protein
MSHMVSHEEHLQVAGRIWISLEGLGCSGALHREAGSRASHAKGSRRQGQSRRKVKRREHGWSCKRKQEAGLGMQTEAGSRARHVNGRRRQG